MKKLVVVGAVILAGVGAYWHYSPYVALYGMRAASEALDAETLNSFVNYPKLRESLKNEIAGELTKNIDRSDPTAALAAATGLAVAEQMVDEIVRPEFVMQAFNQAGEDENGHAAKPEQEIKWELKRESKDRVVVYVTNTTPELTPTRGELGIVLDRVGFAGWELSGIQLND